MAWGLLIGVIIGILTATEAGLSRIMTYFINQGHTEKEAYDLIMDLMQAKYKRYRYRG